MRTNKSTIKVFAKNVLRDKTARWVGRGPKIRAKKLFRVRQFAQMTDGPCSGRICGRTQKKHTPKHTLQPKEKQVQNISPLIPNVSLFSIRLTIRFLKVVRANKNYYLHCIPLGRLRTGATKQRPFRSPSGNLPICLRPPSLPPGLILKYSVEDSLSPTSHRVFF